MDPTERRLIEMLRCQPDVRAAWLFGSRARGDARPDSDWDVLVLLRRDASADRVFKLHALLASELGTDVDVISLDRTSIELATRALVEGRLILSTDEAARVEAEANTLARYHDVKPELDRQRQALLAGERPHDRAVDRYRAALGALDRLRGQADGAG